MAVFTLRCTRKLLARLKAPARSEGVEPTTRLGDWYGNLLFLPGQQVVLLVNERSLLPALVPASPASTLLERLPAAVAVVLRGLGVPPTVVEAELREMQEVVVAKTTSRRVLGTMTDFAFLLEGYELSQTPLVEAALKLAKAPCSPLGMEAPGAAALRLLGTLQSSR